MGQKETYLFKVVIACEGLNDIDKNIRLLDFKGFETTGATVLFVTIDEGKGKVMCIGYFVGILFDFMIGSLFSTEYSLSSG